MRPLRCHALVLGYPAGLGAIAADPTPQPADAKARANPGTMDAFSDPHLAVGPAGRTFLDEVIVPGFPQSGLPRFRNEP